MHMAEKLAGGEVEAIGVCRRVGTNCVLSGSCVRARITENALAAPLPPLTTAEEILRLKPEEARRGYPVRLRGVVTCTWPEVLSNLILQDATRGIFLLQPLRRELSSQPQIGEFWEAEGQPLRRLFPNRPAQKMTRLGEGRLPSPVHPDWDQLLNGSLDLQFVEIEGLIIDFNPLESQATLMTHWGKISVKFNGEAPPKLEQFQNKLVRIRGCLLAVWDHVTHQLKSRRNMPRQRHHQCRPDASVRSVRRAAKIHRRTVAL